MRTNLAGLDEVFHAGWMVFHTSKMESRPPVVVSHVHVDSCQVGSLKSHLVTLRKRLELWNMMRLKREPVRQQTIAGQASGFAPRSFVLWDSSYHCCSRQSRCTKITRAAKLFDCYRVKSVEVIDLDKLLSEHHPSGGVADGVQRWRPGGEPNHIGHNHQHDAGHSRLCGKTNLMRWGFVVTKVAFQDTWKANCPE